MTATNPFPQANPFTDRLNGNVNWRRYASGGYFKALSPEEAKTTGLPDTSFDYNEALARQRELTVPNQGAAEVPSLGIQMCPDGVLRSKYDIARSQTRDDVARQQMLAAKDAELSASMSDFQKDLLGRIEDEFVGHSRLIEESKQLKEREKDNGNQ